MASQTPSQTFIAPTAIVDPTAYVGEGTKIWSFVQIAEHSHVGQDCVIGNGAYIDRHVRVGDRVRIHNKALLYQGVIIEDDVFIGPGVCFTNDARPKSGVTRDLTGKSWKVGKGASIGANATILPDITIGNGAVVGAGSVVTHHVPDYALVYGNPARVRGCICGCGEIISNSGFSQRENAVCPSCRQKIVMPAPGVST